MKESEYKNLCLKTWKIIYTTDHDKTYAIDKIMDKYEEKINRPWSECFACEYVNHNFPLQHDRYLDCSKCPVQWYRHGNDNCVSASCEQFYDSPYYQYRDAKTSTQRKLAAYEVYRRIITTWNPKPEYSS